MNMRAVTFSIDDARIVLAREAIRRLSLPDARYVCELRGRIKGDKVIDLSVLIEDPPSEAKS